MTPAEGLDARLSRLRDATNVSASPEGLDERLLGALARLTRWETALRWCRKALVLSAFATVTLVVVAVWHDDRLTNRVAVAGVDDASTGDP